jgi:hypothetical protein
MIAMRDISAVARSEKRAPRVLKSDANWKIMRRFLHITARNQTNPKM